MKNFQVKNLRKVAESNYTFLTTCDKVEKYTELIEKMLRVKIMKQWHSVADCKCVDNIKILNFVDPELQLNTTFIRRVEKV